MDLSKWTPQSIIAALVPVALIGLVALFTVKGMPVPSWLTDLLAILGGGGLFGLGHSIGSNTAVKAVAAANPTQSSP